MKNTLVFALSAYLMLTSVSFGALNAYLDLTSVTQGRIEGDVTEAGREDSIMIIGFSHEVFTPRDAASGLPTGSRQHEPIRITKEIDKASPILMNVMVQNDLVTEFELSFWRPTTGGGEEHYYTIILHNAVIVSIRQEMLNNKYPENLSHSVREHVTFVYSSIEWVIEAEEITAINTWDYQGADIPISDLTGDGIVNMLDLAILANEWLYGIQ